MPKLSVKKFPARAPCNGGCWPRGLLAGVWLLPVILVPLLSIGITQAQVLPANQTSNSWFAEAQSVQAARLSRVQSDSAKNVILFVGDGMGVSTLTASRILQGQRNGQSGEEGLLSFESFPYSALVKTYNVNAQTPDSAGTMTAMVSGIKTDAGVLGVDEDVVRGECASVFGNEVFSALELAEIKGLATGIVSTARITHATPAATYAKSAERNWEDDSSMPASATDSGCEDIATQLVRFESNLESRFNGVDVNGIEVVMGGGRRHFLPQDATANSPDARSEIEGNRADGRNLIEEWQSLYPSGVYVFDQSGFDTLAAGQGGPVLGLFNESHMQYEADRANDISGEPSLSQMTGKAVDILKQDGDGFFLVVESGRIDHAHHAGNAFNALSETIELADAVQVARDRTDPSQTMILVTADHSHVFTIAGYPKRGNPILGRVVPVGFDQPAVAEDGLPYTTLGYSNGLGFRDLGSVTNADAGYELAPATGRQDLNAVNPQTPGFHQEALIPLSAETHAGEDIAVHATGPGAHLVQGVIEQNLIFHVIDQALDLSASALNR
ncbi:MAG: alkaline phosphatase [Granulosicoccus sp.]|nr:alkaline phosphatase [Granulosicoccus sp.]